MSGDEPAIDEQTRISEITIQPDGRVYVFGASRGVLEVLELLQPHDAKVGRLLSRVRELRAGSERSGMSAGD